MLVGCHLETQEGGSGILAVVYGCEVTCLSQRHSQGGERCEVCLPPSLLRRSLKI